MKKINQSNNILLLVAIALCIKSYMDSSIEMAIAGIVVASIALSRVFLFKKLMREEEDTGISKDLTQQYLEQDTIKNVDMLVCYQAGNNKVLYEENDGVLLYECQKHRYLGTASTLAGAKDIVWKLPQDYEVFIAHDTLFEELENTEFAYVKKQNVFHYVYEGNALPVRAKEKMSIKKIDKSTCSVMACKDDLVLGAFIEEHLVGYAYREKDGMLAYPFVEEAYKEKGIAEALLSAYVNTLLKQKEAIYMLVEENDKEMNTILTALSFTKSKTPCIAYYSDK